MKLLYCLALITLMTSCSGLNKKAGLLDDNILEESVEQKLKETTGVDIDLTPTTPEIK